ncbi:unnamed protein product [Mytilus coruscus]|uniref:Uncharacterized protein n=1 Tax=Mytilus coruscus TaxID=42192 RepID=A0A6J8BQI0_MYTCO|nr:unnamed protein product [Mytilus coruscus]
MEAKFEEKSLCKLCTNFEQEFNKCRQEKNSLQGKYADLFLEREVEGIKYKTEIKIAKLKMDCSNSEIKVLSNQINQYEERLHCKDISLLEMEHKVCEQRNEINKLHEDYSLLKTQVINKSDTKQSNLLAVSKSTNTESNVHQVDVASKNNVSNSTPVVVNNEKQKNLQSSGNFNKGREKRKEILMIGTSNTKYISAKYLSFGSANVKKIIKYKIQEGMEYIGTIADPNVNYDAIILHILGNDIEHKTPEECIAIFQTLIDQIRKKNKQETCHFTWTA